MARLLVYTSLFKFRESAQLLTKGVLEFVIRNFVIEVESSASEHVVFDPFKLASRLEYPWGSVPIAGEGCHSSSKIFVSERVTFDFPGISSGLHPQQPTAVNTSCSVALPERNSQALDHSALLIFLDLGKVPLPQRDDILGSATVVIYSVKT